METEEPTVKVQLRPLIKRKLKKSGKAAAQELESMVGLGEVKSVLSGFLALQKVRTLREAAGLKNHECAKNLLFKGNPGTAKTTVARLLASILKDQGVIAKSVLVECGRGDLVGEYVGQTAPRIEAKFEEAIGGILFIDEAYSLVSDDDYSKEAISTLVQLMENYREKVLCILAGYPSEMDRLMRSNAGLRSRIGTEVFFPDYSQEELWQIFVSFLKKGEYTLSRRAEPKIRALLDAGKMQENFGNGRFVRNLFERAITNQAQRVLRENGDQEISMRDLKLLKEVDFPEELPDTSKSEEEKHIGFGV